MNADQIDKLLNAAFALMDLASDSGVVWAEVNGVYAVARAEGREPTAEERAAIRERALRRGTNFRKILDRDQDTLDQQ